MREWCLRRMLPGQEGPGERRCARGSGGCWRSLRWWPPCRPGPAGRRATERVSVGPGGQQADSASGTSNPGRTCCEIMGAAISANGRFVAFQSSANNLVRARRQRQRGGRLRPRPQARPHRAGQPRDRRAAGRHVQRLPGDLARRRGSSPSTPKPTTSSRTTLTASATSSCATGSWARPRRQPGARRRPGRGLLSAADEPAISPDGRYVAFWSDATNLVATTPTA